MLRNYYYYHYYIILLYNNIINIINNIIVINIIVIIVMIIIIGIIIIIIIIIVIIIIIIIITVIIIIIDKLIKMVNFKLGNEMWRWINQHDTSVGQRGGRSIHWATKTHGEQGDLTEFIYDSCPAYC